MLPKQFRKNNTSFCCIACNRRVPIHPTSSRDHCDYCLTGLHVDINPGDRSNPCTGILAPIGLITKSKRSQIIYRCQKCHQIVKNRVAPDDNVDKLIYLSQNVISYQ